MRFPIRFSGAGKAMAILGLTPSTSYVDVGATTVETRMGWGFRATVDRTAVRRADHDTRRVWGWGAHGWRGEWLVNGSSSGIVRIELEPSGRAHVLGVPVTLRALRVAVEDPDGLLAALSR